MSTRAMDINGGEDIETVRRLAADFMAGYLFSSPEISQKQDGPVPPLVEGAEGSPGAAVAVELLGDVAMAVWVCCIDGQVVVHRVAAARHCGEWHLMAPVAH